MRRSFVSQALSHVTTLDPTLRICVTFKKDGGVIILLDSTLAVLGKAAHAPRYLLAAHHMFVAEIKDNPKRALQNSG